MEKILELRRTMSDKVEEMRTLAESDTQEDITKFDALKAEVEGMRQKEERLLEMEGYNAEDAPPPMTRTVPAQAKNDSEFAFGDFLGAVMRADMGHGIDSRLSRQTNEEFRQSGLNEGVPSEGGWLVKTDHISELLKKTHDLGAFASRVRKIPVSANANGLTINAVDEDSRVTGSRWGGVQAYWLHEAGTKVPSMPAFRQMELKLKKLIGLCYATDELLQDTSALESIVTQAFSEEFAWMIDNSIFRGTGVGQMLGITGHPATIAVPAEAGQAPASILFENIVSMYSRMWARSRANSVWFINQDLESQLYTMSMAVGVGGVPVYLPAGGASASPYSTLFGRPVIPVEQASTLGTVGDISLLDLSQYLMIDKGGMQSASSIHVRFVQDESCFRFVYRCDGAPLWSAALTPANGTNTLSPFIQLETR